MKLRSSIVLACSTLFALGFAGCANKGMIRVGAIEPSVSLVAQRHDAYVINDPTLSEAEKQTYLMTTELLNKVILEASTQ